MSLVDKYFEAAARLEAEGVETGAFGGVKAAVCPHCGYPLGGHDATKAPGYTAPRVGSIGGGGPRNAAKAGHASVPPSQYNGSPRPVTPLPHTQRPPWPPGPPVHTSGTRPTIGYIGSPEAGGGWHYQDLLGMQQRGRDRVLPGTLQVDPRAGTAGRGGAGVWVPPGESIYQLPDGSYVPYPPSFIPSGPLGPGKPTLAPARPRF